MLHFACEFCFVLFWIFVYKLWILVLGIGSVEVGERQTFYCWLRRIHLSEVDEPFDGWMDGLLDFDVAFKILEI